MLLMQAGLPENPFQGFLSLFIRLFNMSGILNLTIGRQKTASETTEAYTEAGFVYGSVVSASSVCHKEKQ